MSYTQHFHDSITVRDSKTIHYNYPPSEHGGSGSETVYFEKTVPLDFNVHVDTSPFDNSVEGAKYHVDGLTGAVVAMNSAQCASIRKSSDLVSDSITKGFYKLIGSELTTQISENKSELQAKIALVMELSKDIASKHARMEVDINRLKKHYAEIFNDLDEDCKKRVLALDKPSFILSTQREKLIKSPYLKDGAFSLQEISDTSNSNNLSTIARLRSQVSKVLNVMANSALKTQQYLKDVETYSENITVLENKTSYIPVIFSEQENLSEKNKKTFSCICNSNVASYDIIQQNINQYVSGVQAELWKDFSNDEEKIISKTFAAYAEQELVSSNSTDKQRIYDEIMKLWKSNPKKTLQGVN